MVSLRRKNNMENTAECVTAWHPDKICDQISDAIVDACIEQDPMSRVAVETMGGHGVIVLTGEATTKAIVNFSDVAKKVYSDLTIKEIGVLTNIVKQSPNISQGVDTGGAGDQGIMIGYACNENEMYIPQELYFAKKLLEPYKVDGKAQVTIKDEKVEEVVLSIQGQESLTLDAYITRFFNSKDIKRYCNNTGAFEIGGFDGDSGVTGRKIIVDAYGPRVPVGGGAFSGKDPTKVDRSGAYMARYIALNLLKTWGAEEVFVNLAYVIGRAEPIMATSKIIRPSGIKEDELNGDVDLSKYDCRPQAIIERFNLRKPIYLQTARQGHFGFKEYPWEQV